MKLQLIKKLTSGIAVGALVNSFHMLIKADGGQWAPYYEHNPEDTGGYLAPIVLTALGFYVLGLAFYLYGKHWEKKK